MSQAMCGCPGSHQRLKENAPTNMGPAQQRQGQGRVCELSRGCSPVDKAVLGDAPPGWTHEMARVTAQVPVDFAAA